MAAQDCQCWDEQCQSVHFEIEPVSTTRNGPSVDRVELWTCNSCATRWLRLTVEDEANPAWSKWFRGLVPADAAPAHAEISPEEALELLGSMNWHYYGGAYYRSSGDRSGGPIRAAQREAALQAA